MDPLTISALIAGGSSIFGGLLGGGASNTAASANNAMLERNAGIQDWLTRDQKLLAERLMAEQKLGQTDPYGSRTHFVEGVGWVTDAAPNVQTDLNASLMNDIYARIVEQRMNNDVNQRSATAGAQADNVANILLNKFNNVQQLDPNALADWIVSASSAGRNDATNALMSGAATQGVRSGNSSGFGNIIAALGKNAGNQFASDRSQAILNAIQFAGDKANSDRTNLANLYGAFRQQGGAPIGAGVPALSVAPPSPANPTGVAQIAAGLNQGLSTGPTVMQQPDYSTANTITQFGQIGSGLFSQYANQQFLTNLFGGSRGVGNTTTAPRQQPGIG